MLYRASKIMTHELSHMLGLRHCIFYQCGMNGQNHIEEHDNTPFPFCVICFRKLQHACGFKILERYEALTAICKEFGFNEDAEWFNRRLEDLKKVLK